MPTDKNATHDAAPRPDDPQPLPEDPGPAKNVTEADDEENGINTLEGFDETVTE